MNILIIAGEPSGDIRGAELLRELKPLLPSDTRFWGIGGDNMEREGFELIEHIREHSIVGVIEAIKSLPKIRRQFNNCKTEIKKRSPNAAILIDYPGFNLRLTSHLKKEKIPVVYYIIPQVWAWGKGRIRSLKRNTDKILVLFEFEKHFLAKHDISAEFTGHPLIDEFTPGTPKPHTEDNLTIALLPGSRKSEILNLFPVMLEAGVAIKKRSEKRIKFILAVNPNIETNLYDHYISMHPGLDIQRIVDNTADVLAASDFAIVTSGTATLETSVSNVPFVIVYKTAALTAVLYYMFLNLPSVGLANIVAQKKVLPELLQWDVTAEKIAEEALHILDDPKHYEDIKLELSNIRKLLGEPGAAKRAAGIVAEFLN